MIFKPGLQLIGSTQFAARLLHLLECSPTYHHSWVLSGLNLGNRPHSLAQALRSGAALLLCEGTALAHLHTTELALLEQQLSQTGFYLVCWNPPRTLSQD